MTIRDLNLSYEQKLTEALEAEPSQARSNKAPRQPSEERGTKKVTHQPAANNSTNHPVGRSVGQSTNRSTDQLTSKVVDRPVSFYIPEIIHQKIDEAVRYYQGNHSKKIDRSAVVSALLGDPDRWTDEALDEMAKKVLEQLTSRMTSRLASRHTD
jgi:hypothetical protein